MLCFGIYWLNLPTGKKGSKFILITIPSLSHFWRHGWTKTKAINAVDNLGSYLSAYLGDIEVTDENKENLLGNVIKDGRNFDIVEKDVADDNGKKLTKKFIKGGR